MAEARALYRALYRETRMALMPSLRDKWRANLREGFHASRNLRGAEAAAQVDRARCTLDLMRALGSLPLRDQLLLYRSSDVAVLAGAAAPEEASDQEHSEGGPAQG